MNNSFRALVLCCLAAPLLGACSKKSDTQAPMPAAAAAKVAGSPTKLAVGQKAQCPVTGEEFVVTATTAQVEQNGKYYAFCCPDCAPTFQKNPAKYTSN
jgi:YHS domain-containing protein